MSALVALDNCESDSIRMRFAWRTFCVFECDRNMSALYLSWKPLLQYNFILIYRNVPKPARGFSWSL